MLKGLRNFLAGWRTVTFPDESRTAAMDLLARLGIGFARRGFGEDGSVTVRMRERAVRTFLPLAREEGILCEVSEVHGLPVVLDFCKKRPMLPLGCLAAACWIAYSTHIVWDVRITGNDKTPTSEIVETLDSLGFGVGSYFPAVDFDKLHTAYAAAQHDIAWLSVYMHGTVAEIQVREMKTDQRQKHPEGVYANVVAAETAIVEEVCIFEGQAAVKAGDLVRPGQVLIAGVVEKKENGIRYEYAAGEIYGCTVTPISVKVETERTKMLPTGREKREKTVKIFKKSINLFTKGGIVYPTYDKISKIEQLCPFGLCALPIWIETTVYRETVEQRIVLTPQEAADQAAAELSEKIKAAVGDGALLEKEISSSFEKGVYTIHCVLTMRRDIGMTVEFTAKEAERPEESSTP